MAYVTGTANSLTDLLTAIQNACTANGWTLSGSVLHKGTCYIEIIQTTTPIVASPLSVGGVLQLRGGRGIDGSNNLTSASDASVGLLGKVLNTPPFSFPLTYFIHVLASPDEVYCIVNHDLTMYQTIAFGASAMPGLIGSGTWYCGAGTNAYNTYGGFNQNGERSAGGQGWGFSLFSRYDPESQSFGVDHSLDSTTWKVEGSWRDMASTMARQPNQWNGESALAPVRVYASRPSGFVSPVLECAHARFVRIANLNDQQVITLGTDKWKIYPWWQRSATVGSGIVGTGYYGHAIRYDGP